MINVLVPRRKRTSANGSKSPKTEQVPGTTTGGNVSCNDGRSRDGSGNGSSSVIDTSKVEANEKFSASWEAPGGTEVASEVTTFGVPNSQNAIFGDAREVGSESANSNSDVCNHDNNDGINYGRNHGNRSVNQNSKKTTLAILNEPPNNLDVEFGELRSAKNNTSASEYYSDCSSSSTSDEGEENHDDSDNSRHISSQSRNNIYHDKLNRTLLERDILQSLGSHEEFIDTKGLSDYELLRLRNIQRNERRMKELGLMSGRSGVRCGSKSSGNSEMKEEGKDRPKGIGTNGYVQQSPNTDSHNGNSNNHGENVGNNYRRRAVIQEQSQLALYYKTEQAPPLAPKTAIHERWMDRYYELKAFYEIYGHILVPSAKDYVASSTEAEKEIGGKSVDDIVGNDINRNGKSKTNATGNSYQYKTLRTWLTKQKRQYLLYTRGEKSNMALGKIELMQQLGGKEWWKRIAYGSGYVWVGGVGWKRSGDHRHCVGSGGGRLRIYSGKRHPRSDKGKEYEVEMRMKMMRDLEGVDEDDEELYYDQKDKEESTLNDSDTVGDWSSSSFINDGEEEEIGSVDSLAQESLDDSFCRRASLRRRSRHLCNGSRQVLHSFDEDIDSIHSPDDRLINLDDHSHASRVSCNRSSEDDKDHFLHRSTPNERRMPSRRDSYYSFEKIYESPKEDECNRNVMRTQLKQQRIVEGALKTRRMVSGSRSLSPRPVIRSTNNHCRDKMRRESHSPSSSSKASTYNSHRHGESSKKRRREKLTRRVKREDIYYREDDASTAVYRRNKQQFFRRNESIQYSERKEYNIHNQVTVSKRLRRQGDRYSSNNSICCSDSSANSISLEDMCIKLMSGRNSHQSTLTHYHKPVREITIASEGQIQQHQQQQVSSVPTLNNYETNRNVLIAEYGRLYEKHCLLLKKANELRRRLMLQATIVPSSQLPSTSTSCFPGWCNCRRECRDNK